MVFSSLAHVCVPTFSDACTIDIVEQGQLGYRIVDCRADFPAAGTALGVMSDWDWSVSIPFACAGTRAGDTADDNVGDADGFTAVGYAGVMTYRWLWRRPSAAEKARAAVLTRHGVATVAQERQLDRRDRRCGTGDLPVHVSAAAAAAVADAAAVGLSR